MKLSIITTVLCLASLPALAEVTADSDASHEKRCDIQVNGRCYKVPSHGNFTVNDKGAFVDGVPLDQYQKDEKTINITIKGNVDTVQDANSVIVTGDVGTIKNGAGDVTVNGNVSLGGVTDGSGNVNIKGEVTGNVQTGSGDIAAMNVRGGISTGSGTITGPR